MPKESKEVRIPTTDGECLCFETYETNPEGCSYIRFIDKQGEEIAYWHYEEWSDDPKLVMGAIMACIQSGAEAKSYASYLPKLGT